MRILVPAIVLSWIFRSAPSSAQLRAEADLQVVYLIAGGSSRPGGRAPATGGAAIAPAGRLLYSLSAGDPYVAVAPAFVSPTSLGALGIVGQIDAGASWHPPARGWYIGTAATLAPSYMRFCNPSWCLKEPVLLYGGESHFGGAILRTENGGGFFASLSVRVLTGRPSAWYWPSLSAEDAAVNHWIVSAGGAASWRF